MAATGERPRTIEQGSRREGPADVAVGGVRGPMRPRRLLSVRARQARRLASHAFRTIDVLMLAFIALVVVGNVSEEPVLQTPLSGVLPYVGGAAIVAHFLRTTGAYRFARRRRLIPQLLHVLAITVPVGAIVAASDQVLVEAAGTVDDAVVWIVAVTATLLVLHTIWWVLVHRWRRDGWLTPNIVLVGAMARAETLITDAMAHGDLNVIGIFDDRLNRSPLAILGVPVLGNTQALVTHRVAPHIDLIIVTVDPRAAVRIREITRKLSELPNDITLMVDQDDDHARVAAVAHLADAPLAPIGSVATAEHRAFAKRVQDLLIGIPLLIVASPVIALLAIAIKLDSRGPVFFKQRRHGFNNEQIVVCKFRTMRQEATDATASRQVTADDDRVTRVGRLLRKTSLDEVPQLINVIRGEMSLVGPRPHAIGMKTGEVESATLVAEYAHRHRIKPGMTGWAAVNGSRGPLHDPKEVQRRVALDVDYIERQSFWLDVKIMLLTVPSLLGDRSAVR